MLSRRVLTAVLFGAALVVVSGCGSTNPVASTNSVLDSTPPAAPQNLKAADDAAGALVLSWDASADADVAGYDVYRYAPDPSRDNAYVKINPTLVTATQYTVVDASTTGDYYRIKAVDKSANQSVSSAAVQGASLTITGGSVGEPEVPGLKVAGR